MEKKITVVLFDLGRVLMQIDFDAFPNGLGLFTEKQRKPYRSPIAQLWVAHETGNMSTDEFLEKLYVIFDKRYSKDDILKAWDSIIVKDNDEIIPFVQKVQKRFRTAILSNTCSSHWKKAVRISPLVRSFDTSFTSFDIGVMKPDKIAYEHVIRSLNVEPHEILFIDDLRENIEGSAAAGMRGIVYTNAEALVKDTDAILQ